MRIARHVVVLACCCAVAGCLNSGEQQGVPGKVGKLEGAGEGRRHHEATAKFSYVPPEGWTVREFPGLKYRIAHTTPVGGFAPNLNVTDEPFQGTVEAYADQNLASLKAVMPGFKLLRREAFQTAQGMACVKFTTENQQGGKHLRQVAYLLQNDGRGLVMTGSALAQGGEQFDAAFDACARSFRFE